MKRVLVNTGFKDRYSGKMYGAGKIIKMDEERIAEVKEVNPNLITVLGNVEEDKKSTDNE